MDIAPWVGCFLPDPVVARALRPGGRLDAPPESSSRNGRVASTGQASIVADVGEGKPEEAILYSDHPGNPSTH
ncbi:hypothetical protein SAMN05421595_2628 [Austwickia chelonae]|nr:hypothetical protein SAMN05421595_2628 [Austwickia chelonae]